MSSPVVRAGLPDEPRNDQHRNQCDTGDDDEQFDERHGAATCVPSG